jgi:UDP-N-acetyl-D-mannosaminuronate dehydrogenase
MVSLSQEINDGMASHVLNLTSDALESVGKDLSKSTILILGISYKPNVKDVQITPAEPIIKKLQEKGTNLKIYDPYFKSASVFNIQTEDNLSDAISNIDAIILITAHDEFRHLDPTFLGSKSKYLVVVDTRGIIDIRAARKAGLIIRGIGRGGK